MKLGLTSKRDPNGVLQLSKCQKFGFGKWLRPSEIMTDAMLFDNSDKEEGKYLVQDIITDCSVVASLCSAASYEVTYKKKVKILPPKHHHVHTKKTPPSTMVSFWKHVLIVVCSRL